jgi:hypothetical protein
VIPERIGAPGVGTIVEQIVTRRISAIPERVAHGNLIAKAETLPPRPRYGRAGCRDAPDYEPTRC